MNPIDLAVLAVVALSAIFAFARGLVREALSIVAWVGAALITFYGFGAVSGIVSRLVATPLLAQLIAGAGLFLVALIILTIATGAVARVVESSALSPIDRTLGLIFGLMRGAVLVSVAYLVVDISLPPGERPVWLREARSEPLLAEGAGILRGILPQSLQLKSAPAGDDVSAPRRTQAARDAMGALSNPAAPSVSRAPNTQAPAYKPAEQHELDRLIDNTH